MRLKYTARSHRYMLDGKPCKSPSAVAKVPDDTTALSNWKRRQTAIGLALSPHLLTSIAAAGADKNEIDALCEEAMAAAGANSGRDYGTAVHRITDAIDGGEFVLDTPEVLEIRRRWQQLLDDHDLEVVASEQVILHPELRIAGRFDRVVRHRASGDLLILDTKTGAEADKYLHSHAVQLALYARAPFRADGPTGDIDFEVTDFVPMWTVRTDIALVAHLPQTGDAAIVPVDIAAGWQCFEQVIRPTWDWRNRTDLRAIWPISRADVLRDRLNAIAAFAPERVEQIKQAWPVGVPPLKAGGHTDDQLDQIEELVELCEQKLMPFDPPPAEPQPSDRWLPNPKRPARIERTPDEGGDADTAAVDRLRQRYQALDDAGRAWIGHLVEQGTRAGRTFNLGSIKSRRSVAIVAGLVTLCEHGGDDEAYLVTRGLTALALDDEAALFQNIPAGEAVSALDAGQAELFEALCIDFAAGRFAAHLGDDGLLRLVEHAA